MERLYRHRLIDATSGCWLWTGSRHKKGYGRIGTGQTVVLVHRLAASIFLDFDLTSTEEVLHHCDTPPCFNPEHLFTGSQADNLADMDAKGRRNNVHGEHHSKAKLTEADIRAIRARRASGERCRAIATDYDLAERTVTQIYKRDTWKHVM